MRIAIVFPHQSVADLVAAGLRAQKGVSRVDVLPSGSGFMRALRTTSAKLFMLDGMSISVALMVDRLDRIRRAHPSASVLLLASEYRETVRLGLQHGVTGVVKADADSERCMEALRQLDQGHSWLPADLVGELVGARAKGNDRSAVAELPARQRQVLELLANGMTVREIAEVLGIGVKTVETHRARLMQQLGARSSHELLVMALQGRVEV
ncbi:response regulator transcription factor [Algiphilus aromaticivorans]|uniref:response regulator transcription factor n=1 Tax=Algiphilus aromaticivorans TaxID=382454 RepID=UPI0005C1B2E9|nr:response regulator transcription factor [Algiphilus aromaticivorans]